MALKLDHRAETRFLMYTGPRYRGGTHTGGCTSFWMGVASCARLLDSLPVHCTRT